MKENGQKLASFKDAGVNLSDFALFLSVMKYPEAHESVLSIIMDEPGLKLARVVGQIAVFCVADDWDCIVEKLLFLW